MKSIDKMKLTPLTILGMAIAFNAAMFLLSHFDNFIPWIFGGLGLFQFGVAHQRALYREQQAGKTGVGS